MSACAVRICRAQPTGNGGLTMNNVPIPVETSRQQPVRFLISPIAPDPPSWKHLKIFYFYPFNSWERTKPKPRNKLNRFEKRCPLWQLGRFRYWPLNEEKRL